MRAYVGFEGLSVFSKFNDDLSLVDSRFRAEVCGADIIRDCFLINTEGNSEAAIDKELNFYGDPFLVEFSINSRHLEDYSPSSINPLQKAALFANHVLLSKIALSRNLIVYGHVNSPKEAFFYLGTVRSEKDLKIVFNERVFGETHCGFAFTRSDFKFEIVPLIQSLNANEIDIPSF